MKKFSRLVLVASAVLSFSTFAQAQKNLSEGKIMFDINIDADMDPQMAAMMPTEMTVFVKKDMSRTVMKTGMGMDQVIITDNKKNESTVLLDIMGNKLAMKVDPNDAKPKTDAADHTKVTVLEEYKDIAGYKCQKAEVMPEKGDKMTVFFTKDIVARNSGGTKELKGIDGFLMEYEVNNPQTGKMRMTAKSVTQQPIADAMFQIPTDYKVTTKEELGKMFGGQ